MAFDLRSCLFCKKDFSLKNSVIAVVAEPLGRKKIKAVMHEACFSFFANSIN